MLQMNFHHVDKAAKTWLKSTQKSIYIFYLLQLNFICLFCKVEDLGAGRRNCLALHLHYSTSRVLHFYVMVHHNAWIPTNSTFPSSVLDSRGCVKYYFHCELLVS